MQSRPKNFHLQGALNLMSAENFVLLAFIFGVVVAVPYDEVEPFSLAYVPHGNTPVSGQCSYPMDRVVGSSIEPHRLAFLT